MVWLLSILLSVVLLSATIAILCPELVLPVIAKKWRLGMHYRNH